MTNDRLLQIKSEYSKKTRDGKLVHVLIEEVLHLRAEVVTTKNANLLDLLFK